METFIDGIYINLRSRIGGGDGFYKNYLAIGLEKFSLMYYCFPELIKKWIKVVNEKNFRKIEVKLRYSNLP